MRWLPCFMLACSACRAAPPAPAPEPAVAAQTGSLTVSVGDAYGVSGLARAEEAFWAVSERLRRVLPLRLEGAALSLAGAPLALAGIPEGTDTESLALWRSGDELELCFGTETQQPRDSDAIYCGAPADGVVRVTERTRLPYAMFGLQAQVNRGVEGLCSAGDLLVAGVETVLERDGQRFAPIATYHGGTGAWTAHLLPLATPTGLVSSLECIDTPAGPWVMAIERHYGVGRLLAARLSGDVLEPVALVVLDPYLLVGVNFEGLAWLGHGKVLLLADNDNRGVYGPTQALVLTVTPPWESTP